MNKQTLDLRLKHSLTLTPQLQQAIKILNMNSLEVELEISQMLAQNFMLNMENDYTLESLAQEDEPNEDEESAIESLDKDIDYDIEDWEQETTSDWTQLQAPQNTQTDANLDDFVSSTASLSSLLIEQIESMPISEELMKTAMVIVYHLDEDGYFRDDLSDLSEYYQINISLLEEALTIVHQCKPSGVGAKNLEQCLNLQIELLPQRTPHLKTLKQIMARYFYFIAKKPALIRKRLQLSKTDYANAISLMRSLDPTPGFSYNKQPIQYIKPDIIVNEYHGISYVEATDNLEVKLSINNSYAALLAQVSGQEKTLLSSQLQEAKWFINTLEKRANTIKQVAGIVVALQQDFFQRGELAMKPLTRQKAAEMLGIHESTVSRAVNGKYLLCKRGIYELRYFFSNSLENSVGEDHSTTAIKAMIVELISKEDTKKPLSDQKISNYLAKEGHQVARRTVAKYRESLNIPTSSVRRIK